MQSTLAALQALDPVPGRDGAIGDLVRCGLTRCPAFLSLPEGWGGSAGPAELGCLAALAEAPGGGEALRGLEGRGGGLAAAVRGAVRRRLPGTSEGLRRAALAGDDVGAAASLRLVASQLRLLRDEVPHWAASLVGALAADADAAAPGPYDGVDPTPGGGHADAEAAAAAAAGPDDALLGLGERGVLGAVRALSVCLDVDVSGAGAALPERPPAGSEAEGWAASSLSQALAASAPPHLPRSNVRSEETAGAARDLARWLGALVAGSLGGPAAAGVAVGLWRSAEAALVSALRAGLGAGVDGAASAASSTCPGPPLGVLCVSLLVLEGSIDALRSAGRVAEAREACWLAWGALAAGTDTSLPTLPTTAVEEAEALIRGGGGAGTGGRADGTASRYAVTRFGPRLGARAAGAGGGSAAWGRRDGGGAGGGAAGAGRVLDAGASAGLASWATAVPRLPCAAVAVVWHPLASVRGGDAALREAEAAGGVAAVRAPDAEDVDEEGIGAEAAARAASARSRPALRCAVVRLGAQGARRHAWARVLHLRGVALLAASLGAGFAEALPGVLDHVIDAVAAGASSGASPGRALVARAAASALAVAGDATSSGGTGRCRAVALPPARPVPASALCPLPTAASLVACHVDAITARVASDLQVPSRLAAAPSVAAWVTSTLLWEGDPRGAASHVADLTAALLQSLSRERVDAGAGEAAVPAILRALAVIAGSLGDEAARAATARLWRRGAGVAAIEGSGGRAAAPGTGAAAAALAAARFRVLHASESAGAAGGVGSGGVWAGLVPWARLCDVTGSAGEARAPPSASPPPAPSSVVRRLVAAVLHRAQHHVGSFDPAAAGASLECLVACSCALSPLPGLLNPVLFRVAPALLARMASPSPPEVREVAVRAFSEIATTAFAGHFLRLRLAEAALPAMIASLAEDVHWISPAGASGGAWGLRTTTAGRGGAGRQLLSGEPERGQSAAERLAAAAAAGPGGREDSPHGAGGGGGGSPRRSVSLGRFGKLQLATLRALRVLCGPTFVHDDPARGSEDDHKGPGAPGIAPERVDDKGRVWRAMARRDGPGAAAAGARDKADDDKGGPDRHAHDQSLGDEDERAEEGSVTTGRLGPSLLRPHAWQLLVLLTAFLHRDAPLALRNEAAALVRAVRDGVEPHAPWALAARIGPRRAVLPPPAHRGGAPLRPAPSAAAAVADGLPGKEDDGPASAAAAQAAGPAEPLAFRPGWLLSSVAPAVALPRLELGGVGVSVGSSANPVPPGLELTSAQLDSVDASVREGTALAAGGASRPRDRPLARSLALAVRSTGWAAPERLALAAPMDSTTPWRLPAPPVGAAGDESAALVAHEALRQVRVVGVPLRGAEAAAVALHAEPGSIQPRADYVPGRAMPSGSRAAARVLASVLRQTSHDEEPGVVPGAGRAGSMLPGSVHAQAVVQGEGAPSAQASAVAIVARVSSLTRWDGVWGGLRAALDA